MTSPLGLEAGIVRLVEYDVRWPVLFTSERDRIAEQCQRLDLHLEHVGGTAIPGMWTKPVLDIAAGRRPGTAIEDCIGDLLRTDYEHRGELGVPGRHFFCRGTPRACHLHLVEDGGPLWLDFLAVRDYLRSHAAAADRFAAQKRALAARFPQDRDGYTNAKAVFVEDLLRLAGRRVTR